MYPIPALAQQLEREWASELAAYFERNIDDVFAQVRLWLEFPIGVLRIELMDGSFAQFKYAVFIVSQAKKAIAVFTEHCGNHIYPYHDAKVYRDEVLVYAQRG